MKRNHFSNAVKRGAGFVFGCWAMSQLIEAATSPVKRKKLRNASKSVREAFSNKKD